MSAQPFLLHRRSMLVRGFGCATALTCASEAPGWAADTEPGRIDSLATPDTPRLGGRQVRVWQPDLPAAQTQVRHQVLYMHDGQNVFDGQAAAFGGQSWGVHRHLQALINDGAIPPTLVVAIHNTPLRWREYVPAPAVLGLPAELGAALTSDPSPQARLPLSDAYVDFIVDELKPLIDRRYRTLPGRESTFVMGSSMGGMVSLYALLRRPDAFAGAACLSTHWPVSVNYPLLVPPLDDRLAAVARRYLDWLAQALPAAGRHRLYFDHGTTNLDSLYPVFQRRMDRICIDRGYRPHRDLLSLSFDGADHNERSWRERGQVPLGFLLRPAG